MAIIKNSAQCLHCGDILESKHRHDFVPCSCWSEESHHGIFVDGGTAYLRRGYHNYSDMRELSEFAEDEYLDEE